MFDIRFGDDGRVVLSGRLDAAAADRAQAFLETIRVAAIVDFTDLSYISSAGLGALVGAQKRLMQRGSALTLVGMNPHIRDVFRFSGLDRIFEIAPADPE